MKYSAKLAVITGVLLGFSFSVQASTYIGLDGSSVAVGNQANDELNPHGVRLRMGLQLNEYFDVETHLGVGTDNRAGSFDSFSTSLGGAYLKAFLPFGARSSIFGLAGIAGISHVQTIDGREFTDSQSGFSYGFGMETQITDRLDLSADFIRYNSDGAEYSDLSALSLGIKWYF